jgi:hypothetical protein
MFFLCKRENIIGVLTIEEQKKGDGKPIYLHYLRGKTPGVTKINALYIFEAKGSALITKESLRVSEEAVIAPLLNDV